MFFSSKRNQKQFFSKTSKPTKPLKNIPSLHNDPVVSKNFSDKLDVLLSANPPDVNDVNIIESLMTDAILQASEDEVPKIEATTKKIPLGK